MSATVIRRRRLGTAPKARRAAAAPLFAFEQGTIAEAMVSRGERLPQFQYIGVVGGYRLHDHTVGQALRTLLHWHNESVNVWVHVLGFCICAGLLVHAGSFAVGAPLPLGPFGAAAGACARAAEPVGCVRALVLASLPRERVEGLLASLASEGHLEIGRAHV